MGVQVRGRDSLFGVRDSLDELEQLARTAGLEVVGRGLQRMSAINPGTYIGSGKLEELGALRGELGFDLLVFDEELSAAQLGNLEDALGIKVLDRTALILDIFAMHARTKEGALQVELAQYAYRLPRLTRQWTHLSRQGVGGVGLRGPGETQLEVDRREVGRRMARLRDELEKVRRQRALHRRRRRRKGMAVASIVGYTNAGKSTLLNRLSGADVLVQDLLFATLDPTTRRVSLPSGKEVLFTDTVGFIQKLPIQLVTAFRATLEEIREADVLVHVVDVSERNVLPKVAAVEEVLRQIEAHDKPVVIALNKVDLVDPESDLESTGERFSMRRNLMHELADHSQRIVSISARQGVGIEDLLAAIEEMLVEQMVEVDLTLPYAAGDMLSLWHKQGVITQQEYGQSGIRVRGRLPRWLVGVVTERA
jgi:GTP-binding protein HflX